MWPQSSPLGVLAANAHHYRDWECLLVRECVHAWTCVPEPACTHVCLCTCRLGTIMPWLLQFASTYTQRPALLRSWFPIKFIPLFLSFFSLCTQGVDVTKDIYGELMTLKHLVNTLLLPGDGSSARPARSCKQLMLSHPGLKDGKRYATFIFQFAFSLTCQFISKHSIGACSFVVWRLLKNYKRTFRCSCWDKCSTGASEMWIIMCLKKVEETLHQPGVLTSLSFKMVFW